MDRRTVALALLVVGVAAMANPLYLPIGPDYDEGYRYVYDAEPVDANATATADPSATYDYDALPPDARRLVREATDGRYVTAAPVEPFGVSLFGTSPGRAAYRVATDDAAYRLTVRVHHVGVGWTLAVQRVVVMPALFLGGFFAVVAVGALAMPEPRDR